MANEDNYLQADLLKSSQKLLAFDIETQDFDDSKDVRSAGITCAAAVVNGVDLTIWYGGKQDGEFNEQMTKKEVLEVLDHLWSMVEAGYQIYTWNGLGFDFNIMYKESGNDERCKQMARSHVDMMFHFFCIKGYAISLEKAARGMGLKGKTEGMEGALAPTLWKQGEFSQVLDYLEQDVRVTLSLAKQCDLEKQMRWTSNTGRKQVCSLPAGWLTVDEVLKLPEPDTSWMSTPWPRSKFTGWL